MSNLFTGVTLLALLAAVYFLARAIIALVKKESAGGYAKKMVAAVAVVIIGSMGVAMTQTPEQKAEIKARQEAREKEEADKKLAEQKAAAEKVEAQKVVEAQKTQDAMTKELTTGWNVKTTDTASDNTNLLKAATLVVKYPNHIHEAPANWISPAVAMKKPWEFYGQVVNFSGQVYAIEQLPPAHPAAKFFGGDCYDAMLAVEDNVAVSMIIVGDSSGISERTTINVKGYIYGHAALVNKLGGESRGLAFVGFAE